MVYDLDLLLLNTSATRPTASLKFLLLVDPTKLQALHPFSASTRRRWSPVSYRTLQPSTIQPVYQPRGPSASHPVAVS